MPNSRGVGQIIARTLFVLFLAGLVTGLPWAARQPPAAAQKGAATLEIAPLAQSGARISYHAQTGQVRFVGAAPGRAIPQPSVLAQSASREDAARGFLAVYGPLFGLSDPNQELIVKRETAPGAGRAFVRFQQVYQGLPVFGGELIVQVDGANNILSASGEVLPKIAVATTPVVTAAAARQAALELVAKQYGVEIGALIATQPELWVLNPVLVRPGGGQTRLVWRLEVTPARLLPIRELVLVDAQRGSVALHFGEIDAALNRQTYNANNGLGLPGTLVCDESNPTCSGGDSHAVAAHKYAGDTYNFYLSNHGRDSIDDAGMTLISIVHYSSGYANAFWNGAQMVYGDAYGFPLADDVVGHELTHGVTEHESNLFYYYQAGAINESLSDVWGEFVDLTNGAGNDSPGVRWQIGEDISVLGALRNMQDPTLFSDPDMMMSTYYTTTATDNGGVHTNSGVNNKAAYLMTDGGTFNGRTVTGLGLTKVAKIYYEVQTNLLFSGADYADLYDALYQACLNLIGTAGITAGDCAEVRDATDAVEMNLQPVAGFNTEAPVCSIGQSPTDLFFDGLEGGTGNWTFGAISGMNRWGLDTPFGPFAHSGAHSLYADDYPAATSDSYAAMNVSVVLPAGAYLHFAHAYGFEDPNFDGGVLEYSTNGGGLWTDAGSLFDANGYDGALSSFNPLFPRSAFLGDSHGYISSRLNLNALAGQSARFRWRMGIDNSVYDWGWWVDDVHIYTCAATPTALYLPIVIR